MKVRQIRKAKYVKRTHKPKHWSQYLRHAARHLKIGTIIETCGCDVAQVTFVDPNTDDLEYVSLTRGGRGCCSIFNCAPQRLNQNQAERRLALYKEGGMNALSKRYYVEDCHMTPEAAQEIIDEWMS